MELLNPVESIAPSPRGRWAPVWQRVISAAPLWVPVVCDNEKDAARLRWTSASHRTLRIEARKDGRTVFLRMRPSEVASGEDSG